MAQRDRETLKTFFQTGDKPTEAQFADFIDSMINILDDGLNAPLIDTFTDADLVSGVLTIAHSLNVTDIIVTVYNNNDIQEDLSGMLDISDPDNTVIDFGGSINGTWKYILQYWN